MHPLLNTPIMLFLIILSPFLLAEPPAEEIDPVIVSADLYKVLLENDHVRVVEYQVPPGQKDNWHTHPAKISYIVSGGTLKITTADGSSFVVQENAGAASWFGAVGKHYGENIGQTPVRIVFVEIKGAEAEKDDLERFRKITPPP